VPPAVAARYGQFRDANEAMIQMRDIIRDETDRDARMRVNKYMIGMARAVMGKEALERYPNPFAARDLPADVQAIVDKELVSKGRVFSSLPPKEPKGGKSVEDRRVEWRQELKIAVQFFEKMGVDEAHAREVYQKHVNETYKEPKSRIGAMARYDWALRNYKSAK